MPFLLRVPVPAVALATLLASGVSADTVFDAPADFVGRIMFSGPQRSAIYPGSKVEVTGSGFAPQQRVTLQRGQGLLSSPDLQADAEGGFTFSFDLPTDAVVGQHPVVVLADDPDSAAVTPLKVSPQVPLAGADDYETKAVKVTPGVYQVAHSANNDTVFVASAVGRPPEGSSSIAKLDAATLEVLAQTDPGDFGAFGIGVDDANDTVWVTNTRHNAVAVYTQGDLSLIKQFETDTVEKPRDVVIDETRGRAYVSTHRNRIESFDTETLEKLDGFELQSEQRGESFAAMSLALDQVGGQLYTVSLRTPEAARIDLDSGEVTIFALPGVKNPSGVDIDPRTGRIFVASQGSDNVIAINGESGQLLFDTRVGAGPLNIAFDVVSGQLFVASRASDTITVLDGSSGKIRANLDGGPFPNHLIVTPDGTVFSVNKARGQDDSNGDRLSRIAPDT
ncbi:Vgb family protein [Pontibaca methylaminivorans]|uniref:DNA-binding beta-propeller fold protein YncE n=1 Tax=Pontibaca methylaminivorans TaxID=515897 RepID=A0A1R3X7F0_9RHOB|nr:YncE family protein [Pontibaca methylaminivorans]SIT86803.1 DNA-binding beta-propeller fold protein YncE [Pontibaca methylaminivorans]